jgi:hypothetical protein
VDGEVIEPRSSNLVEPAKKGILAKVSFDKKILGKSKIFVNR